MNIIPEAGITFSVYYDGEDRVGVAEGEFPNLEAMTVEIQGAGLAGKHDAVILGHFNAMSMALTWRNTTDAFVKLSYPKTHDIDLYAAQQDYDAGLGEYKEKKIHVFVKAIPKTLNIGKMAVAETTDTKSEFSVTYLKLEIDNKERIEYDPFNYICKIDGVDYLAGVRAALGKE